MGDTEGRSMGIEMCLTQERCAQRGPLRIFGKGPLFSYRRSGVVSLSLCLPIGWTPGKFFISFACIFSSINLTCDQTSLPRWSGAQNRASCERYPPKVADVTAVVKAVGDAAESS